MLRVQLLRVQLFVCSIVRLFNCSLVQLLACSIVQMFVCSIVQLFNCSNVQLFNCSNSHLFIYSNSRLFKFPSTEHFEERVHQFFHTSHIPHRTSNIQHPTSSPMPPYTPAFLLLSIPPICKNQILKQKNVRCLIITSGLCFSIEILATLFWARLIESEITSNIFTAFGLDCLPFRYFST